MSNNFNKKQIKYLPILSSETSLNNFKRMEDSRKSSERISFSENYSLSGSTQGIKDINFTKKPTKEKNKKIFLLDTGNIKQKLSYQTKYSKIFNNTTKNPNKLKKADFFIENKLVNEFNITKKSTKTKTALKKEQKNKYNISILQKFNKDIKKYLINSLDNSKNEIQKSLTKINKTFNKTNLSLNQKNDSKKSEQSQRSFSLYSLNAKENNIENKILKTKYSSKLIKINKYYKRKRNFRQYIDEKKFLNKEWNAKIGIIKSNLEYNLLLSNDIKFQAKVIKDELCILNDDIQYYRLKFYGNNDLFSSFKNMEISKQVQVNLMLEETCVLLYYIPKIILKEYNKSTDKFIAIDDPSKEMFSKKIVYNELETFQENLKYLYKISNFIKCCGEVYLQLILQVEDEMLISAQNFSIFREILKRIRLYIISLTNISKNILTNYCFDKYILINKFKKIINQSKIDNKRIYTEKKPKKMTHIKYRLIQIQKSRKIPKFILRKSKIEKNNNEVPLDIEDEKKAVEKMNDISKSFGNKNNYIRDKITRIKKALELNNIYDKENMSNNKDKSSEKKNSVKPMACINSYLMSKMLKYMNKDIKEQIISLRTCERHLNNNCED